MARLWKQLVSLIRRPTDSGGSAISSNRRQDARRRLRVEMLEQRQLMAANIQGVVFQDTTDNGLGGADPLISGVTISLFRDGGNGTFDNGGGDDIASGTTTSAVSTGAYSFSVNTAGNYYVVQSTVAPGLIQRPAQRVQSLTVTSGDITGSVITTLDSFNTTQQIVNAAFPGSTPQSSAVDAPEAIGNERDIFVDATAGNISVSANAPANPGLLVFDVGAVANGTRLITYDGDDNNAQTLNNNGLAGFNLTSGGANAFRFVIGGETGTQLIVRVFSGANSSTRTVTIPVTLGGGGSTTQDLDIPFADFTVNAGTGANFSSVGAIQLEVTGPNSADAIINSFSTVAPTVFTRNFANLTPMSIGNQVFADRNNNGLFDTGATPAEVGVASVQLQLFLDSNSNGTYNPGTDTAALDTSGNAIVTTANSSGIYNFTNLLPGSYFVVIPATNFAGGGAAVGHVVSSTVPAGQTNNANVGTAIAGGAGAIVSSLITLAAGAAPTTDGDSDVNTNNAIDFGLFSQFDVTVNKTTTATEAAAGSTITYTVTVRNDGPGPATGVTLTDNIPDGIRVISATSSNGGDVVTIPATAQDTTAANPDDITVTIGTLAASATTQRTLTIVALVLPNTVGTGSPLSIINSATVSGLGTETGSLTNSSSSTLPVTRNAVLAITKTGSPAAVAVGSNVTYTVTLRNTGPATARNTIITDTLPVGLDLISVTSNVGTATPTQGAGGAADSFTVTVPEVNVDSPSVDTDVVVTVVAQVLSGIAGTTFTNTVNGDSDDSAAVTANVTNNVQRNVDLVVTKTVTTNPPSGATPPNAAPNSTFTYTILARNDGPNDATTVRVTDNIPDGIRITSVTSSDGTDTITIPASAQDTTAANPDDIIINLGNLAVGAGAQTTITLIGVILPGTVGNFTNVATIAATDTTLNNDTNGSNNSSSVAANAQRTVDLTVSKTGPATAVSGNTITYTMTATNNGPSDAINVQVADNIPDGIRVISATLNGTAVTVPATASDTNAANPDDIIFTVGNLASGASVNTLQIVAAILPATAAGSLINSAVISTTDVNSVETPNNNNAASFTTTVSVQNDVAITKSGPATIPAGTELTYTLNVTNSGPSTATSIAVSDVLPAGLTFVSGTSTIGGTTAGTVSATGNTASVTIPTLNPSETAIVTIRATVSVTVTGNISNTATATAANDTNAANNTSAAVTTNVTAPPVVSFAGRIYNDANRNSVFDSGDGGIAGITVTLNGTPINSTTPVTVTTTTNANGEYSFANVSQGTYTVSTGTPSDFAFLASNPGTTGGNAGTNQVGGANVNGNSASNNIGFTRVFSKRLFLASSPRP
ncbi:MAG: DUF11 domain-containing protein [Planctomycetes bacterium]|nr:DUF11 domain-containing protein [Planctomycetota bacterium]